MMSWKLFIRIVGVLFVVMSVLLVIILFVLPVVSGTPPVKRFVFDLVKENSGLHVEAEQFHLAIVPHPRLAMEGIVLSTLGTKQPLGTIQSLEVNFQILPFASQPVVITSGVVVKPEMQVRMDTLESHPSGSGDDFQTLSALLAEWPIQDLHIRDGRLAWIQSGELHQGQSLSWSDIDLQLHGGVTPFSLDVHLSARQQLQPETSQWVLHGKIMQPNIADPAMEHGGRPGGLSQFTGELQVTDLALRPLMEFFQSEPLPELWSASGQVHASIEMFVEETQWNVSVPTVTAQMNDLQIQGRGHVMANPGSSPTIFFQGASSPTSLQALQDLLPPHWLPADIHDTLLSNQVKGTLEVLTATIAGSFADEEALSIMGTGVIKEGEFRPVPDLPAVTNISAHVEFNLPDLRVSDILADYGSTHLRPSMVHVAFPDSSPVYTAALRVDWDARDVMRTVRQFPRISEQVAAWLPVDDVQGKGDLDIHLSGSFADPAHSRIEEALVRAHHVGMHVRGFPVPIKDWSGTLHWVHEELFVEKVAGSVGGTPVAMSGTVSNRDAPHIRNGVVQAEVALADLRALFPDIPQSTETLSGTIGVRANLSGPFQTPHYDGHLDLRNLAISVPSIMQKSLGAPAQVAMRGMIDTVGTLAVDELSIHFPPFALGGHGKVSLEPERMIEASVYSQPGEAGPSVPALILGGPGFSPNHLDVALDLQGTGEDWTRWHLAGFIAASETERKPGAQSKGRKELALDVTLEDQTVHLNYRTEGLGLDMVMNALGSTSPPLRGILSLDGHMDIRLQKPPVTPEAVSGELTFLVSNGRLHHITTVSRILGVLNLPSLLTGKIDLLEEGMPFDQFTGTVSIENGVVASHDLLVDSPVMKLAAAGTYHVTRDQLDAVVAVSPFGSYSDLLKSVPLFGQLLIGERQGLATALFKVTGSSDDPTVQYQPLKSLAGGVQGLGQLAIDVLTNFVTIPMRAIEPTDKDPSLEKEIHPKSLKGGNGENP